MAELDSTPPPNHARAASSTLRTGAAESGERVIGGRYRVLQQLDRGGMGP